MGGPEQEVMSGEKTILPAEALGMIERFLLAVNLLVLALSFALLVTFWLGKVFPILLAAVGLPLIVLFTYFFVIKGNLLRWTFRKSPKTLGGLVILGLLVAGGLYLRYPTSAYIHGGQDQGSYFNIAAWMAKNGTYERHDQILADAFNKNWPFASLLVLNPYKSKGVQQKFIPGEYEGERFVGGFTIKDRKNGYVIPQFYPLTPLLLTTSYWLFGPPGTADILPIFGVLAALGAALLAFRIWKNLFVSALVLLTLLVSGLEVFFSGFPVSEIISQYFILSGMWLLTWGMEDRNSSLTLLAGFNFTAALFNHLTTFFYLAPITALYILYRPAYDDHDTQKSILVFYYTFLGGMVFSLISARIYHGYYVYRNLRERIEFFDALGIDGTFLLLFALIALAISVSLFFHTNLGKTLKPKPSWVRNILFSVTALTAIAISAKVVVYELGIINSPGIEYTYFSSITSHISYLGWGFLLWGIFKAISMNKGPTIVFPVLTLTSISFLFLFIAYMTSYQWYFDRYYVKELYPLGILFIAYGIYQLSQLKTLRGLRGRIVSGVFACLLLIYAGHSNLYLFKHPFLNGAYRDLLSLNSHLSENSIIIFVKGPGDPYTLPDSNNRLTVPLTYSFGHDVLCLPFGQGLARMIEVVRRRLSIYQRPIYLLYIAGKPLGRDFLPPTAKYIESHIHTFTQPELVYHIPRDHWGFIIGTHLYAL